MPGTTPVYGFPYPEPTDLVADYPALGQQLAEDIEDVLPTLSRIVQVVQTVKTDTFSTSSTSFTDVTGLSASITPGTATNKVLVVMSMFGRHNGDCTAVARLMRGATAIAIADAAGNRTRGTTAEYAISNLSSTHIGVFLDSPATTSATTYKVQVRVDANAFVVNDSGNGLDATATGRGISAITLLEVKA